MNQAEEPTEPEDPNEPPAPDPDNPDEPAKPKMYGEWLEEVLGEHPNADPKEQWLPTVVNRAEALALADCPALDRVPKLALRTLYATGIRQEELVALGPGSLDLEHGTVKAGDRWVVLDPDTLSQLKEVLPWTLTPEDLQAELEKAARATGVWERFQGTGRVLLPKALRHAFATHCFENGMDLFSLHALLGNKRIETTEMYVETAIARWRPAYLNYHPLAAGPLVTRGGGEQAALTEADTLTLIGAADPGRNQVMLRTIYASALREHELTTLCFADLFLDECRIFVRKGKDSLDRYTVIDIETARQLRELQGHQPMSARVFPIGDHQVWTLVKLAVTASGLQPAYPNFTISPHTLRHAHGNHCYHRGVDLYALKKLLGHRYLKNTLEYVDCQLPRWREVYDLHHPFALLKN